MSPTLSARGEVAPRGKPGYRTTSTVCVPPETVSGPAARTARPSSSTNRPPGTTSDPDVPRGAVTVNENTDPCCDHEADNAPFGVGTAPRAHETEPGCGETVHVAKPGEVGETPSSSFVSAGTTPVDQPCAADV
jgi:hypothetical protein